MMRFVWMLQFALLLMVPAGIYAYRHRGDPPRAVRGAGLVLAATYVGFAGLFVAGETLSDPGGWAALGMVGVWLVPMVLLSLLAWRRPDPARVVLALLVLGAAGLAVWSGLDAGAWRSFEDDTGPVRGVITMALTAPIAVLALRHVRDAGWLLVVLALTPLATMLVQMTRATGGTPLSLLVLDAPTLVIAALFLVSAHLEEANRRTGPRPRARPLVPPHPAR